MTKNIFIIFMSLIVLTGCANKRFLKKYEIPNNRATQNSSYIPNLISAQKDPSRGYRMASLSLLVRNHYSDPRVIEVFIGTLEEKDFGMQRQAYFGLKMAGDQEDIIVPWLIRTLADPRMDVKVWSMRELPQYGAKAKNALPILKVLSVRNKRAVEKIAKAAITQINISLLVEENKQKTAEKTGREEL